MPGLMESLIGAPAPTLAGPPEKKNRLLDALLETEYKEVSLPNFLREKEAAIASMVRRPHEQTPEELTKAVVEGSGGTPWYATAGQVVAGPLRGAGMMAGRAIEGVGRIATEELGLDPDVVGLVSKGQDLQEAVGQALPVSPEFEGGLLQSLTEGAGSLVPSAASFGLGGIPAIAATGASAAYAGTFDETLRLAEAAGLKGDEARNAARNYARVSALATGVTEPLGAAARGVKILKRLDDATGKWLGNEILKASGGEALQEGLQEMPDEVARQAYIAERTLFESIKAVGGAAAIGGTIGLIFGGMAGAPSMVRAIANYKMGRDRVIEDYRQRVEAGQSDPTPSQQVFEANGLEGGTRKERAAEVQGFVKEAENAAQAGPVEEGGQVQAPPEGAAVLNPAEADVGVGERIGYRYVPPEEPLEIGQRLGVSYEWDAIHDEPLLDRPLRGTSTFQTEAQARKYSKSSIGQIVEVVGSDEGPGAEAGERLIGDAVVRRIVAQRDSTKRQWQVPPQGSESVIDDIPDALTSELASRTRSRSRKKAELPDIFLPDDVNEQILDRAKADLKGKVEIGPATGNWMQEALDSIAFALLRGHKWKPGDIASEVWGGVARDAKLGFRYLNYSDAKDAVAPNSGVYNTGDAKNALKAASDIEAAIIGAFQAVQAKGVSARPVQAKQLPSPPQGLVAKEPWEMTREEWVAESGYDPRLVSIAERVGSAGRGKRRVPSPGDMRELRDKGFAYQISDNTGTTWQLTESGRQMASGHRMAVVAALRSGKPVAPGVLREYPDIDLGETPVRAPSSSGTVEGTTPPVAVESVGRPSVEAYQETASRRKPTGNRAVDMLLSERQRIVDEAWDQIATNKYDEFPIRGMRREYQRKIFSIDRDLKNHGYTVRDLPSLDRVIESRLMQRELRRVAEQKRGTTVRFEEEPVPPQGEGAEVIGDREFQQTDEALQADRETEESLGAIHASFRGPIAEGQSPANYWPSAEVGRRVQGARGVGSQPWHAAIENFMRTAWEKISRAHHHIPTQAKFASALEGFNQLSFVRDWAKREATKRVNSVVQGMSKADYDVFQDQVLVDNLIANRESGRSHRMGFTGDAELQQAKASIDTEVANRPAVQAARQRRDAIVNEIAQASVNRGLLPEEALENTDRYMHQQVLMFANARQSGQKPRRAAAGSAIPRPGKAPFQRKRSLGDLASEDYDFNTNYIESEALWMADAMARVRVHDIVQEFLRKPYHEPTKGAMQKEAADYNAKHPNDPPLQWTDMDPPDGWELMPAKLGTPMFPAFTIPERIAAQLQAGLLAEASISQEDLKRVPAIGQHELLVLPSEVVAQVQEVEKRSKQHDKLAGKISQEIIKLFKIRSLFTPGRLLGYRLRQAFGDLDPLVGGLPGAVSHAKEAVTEMKNYWYGRGGASPDAEKAASLGVFNASWSFDELPDLKDLEWFRRFYESRFDLIGAPARMVSEYFAIVKKNTNWQESIMRYAAYKQYLGLIRDGKLENFGAGNRELVKQLIREQGPEVAAAHLSRRLLGDYANLTVLGKWLRAHAIPFWSFQEINMQRYPRMAWNAATMGDMKSASNAVLLAFTRALITSRLAWMLAGLWAWNNLLHDDEEDDLDPFTQQNPHLNVGRHPDGSVMVLRSVGSLGELLEWFGINTAITLSDELSKGEISAANLAREMARDPINKLAGMTTPLVKAPIEVASGQSYFPDPLNPRRMDRADLVAQNLGLGDEWKAAKGAAMKDGSRARPDYWQRYVLPKIDPRQSAVHRTYDLVGQWQRDKGKSVDDFHGAGDPYYRNMRLAAMNNDREAFAEAFKAFKANGKRRKNFDSSLRHLDPLTPRSGFTKDDRKAFLGGLTDRQRESVTVSRDYANDLRTTLIKWWDEEVRASK